MGDLLVKLYDLALDFSFVEEQRALGIVVRKPIGPESEYIISWVKQNFPTSGGWPSEVAKSMQNTPMSCFIARDDKDMLGFGCYDATALGFFGPLGVNEKCRGKGTGRALLLSCLLDMKLKGYGYAAIGGGIEGFYEKNCGAVRIPDSEPGIFNGMMLPK